MAAFSKKHYQMIARILCADLDLLEGSPIPTRDAHIVAVSRIALRFADALEQDNPRFNREHFLAVVRGERPVTSRPPRS